MRVNIPLFFMILGLGLWSWTAQAQSAARQDLTRQGFAGLGGSVEGFAPVLPGRVFEFPADYGPHADHRVEWWYVTANLVDDQGVALGVQWTLFRSALAPGPLRQDWASPHLWMAHAGLTTKNRHLSAEAFGRAGEGRAATDPVDVQLHGWRFTQKPDGNFGLRAKGQTRDGDREGSLFSYDLQLIPTGPEVLHGKEGYSQKSQSGQASYYFSHPFLAVDGFVTISGERRHVQGQAWLDREWSSQPLSADQKGWDWFSLHLPEGRKLMLFRLRSDSAAPYLSGSLIAADGRVTPLMGEAISLIPLDQYQVVAAPVPVAWHIKVPDWAIDIRTEALNPSSWMDLSVAYWEGPIGYDGVVGGKKALGSGYLEMTGY